MPTTDVLARVGDLDARLRFGFVARLAPLSVTELHLVSEVRVWARYDFEQLGKLDRDRGPEHIEVDVEVVMDEAVAHAGCGGPGTAGWASRVGLLTCLAASPMISISLARPRRSNSSSSRADRSRPAANATAFSAASIRCWILTLSSSCGIQGYRRCSDAVTEVVAEVLVGPQLDFSAADQCAELELEFSELQ